MSADFFPLPGPPKPLTKRQLRAMQAAFANASQDVAAAQALAEAEQRAHREKLDSELAGELGV